MSMLAVGVYLQTLRKAHGFSRAEMGGALKELGSLAQSAENTNQWKLAVAVQMGRIRAAHEIILKMDAPPKIGALRAATLNATSDCNASTEKLASGLDNNRPADIAEASTLMISCGEKIQEVMPELKKLQS